MDRQVVPSWESEVQRRRTVFLDQLLRAATVAGFVGVIVFYLSLLPRRLTLGEQLMQMIPFLVAWLIVLATWLWRGLGYRARTWILLVLAYGLGIFVFVRGDLPGSGRVWLLLPPALALVLLGIRPGIWSGGISVLIYVIFAVLFSQGWLEPLAPLEQFGVVGAWAGEGASFLIVGAVLVLLLVSFSQGWLDTLAGTSAINEQLQARTEELEETTRQLGATAAISQACSSILEPERLLVEVVNRIQKELSRMGVYYVGLFSVDKVEEDGGGEFAVLRAATGSAGQQLLEQGHRLALDRVSAVGRCIVHQQDVMAPSAEGEIPLLDNVLLDRTRSEIALPLRSRGRILGALSVHSVQEAAFDEDDAAILQAMADQVAVAFDNARLFAQTEAALREVQAAQRRYLSEAWREFLDVGPVTHVDYVQPGEEAGDGRLLREARRAAVVHERTVATEGTPSAAGSGFATPQSVLAVPLKLRGLVVGTLSLHDTHRHRSWTSEEIALAETVAEQVAQTVENLRLMDETQRRAARERLVGEIADHLQRAPDMEMLLQIAAEELNRVLGGSRAYVRLGMGLWEDEPAGGGEPGNV